jgi:hypothetical protein
VIPPRPAFLCAGGTMSSPCSSHKMSAWRPKWPVCHPLAVVSIASHLPVLVCPSAITEKTSQPTHRRRVRAARPGCGARAKSPRAGRPARALAGPLQQAAASRALAGKLQASAGGGALRHSPRRGGGTSGLLGAPVGGMARGHGTRAPTAGGKGRLIETWS